MKRFGDAGPGRTPPCAVAGRLERARRRRADRDDAAAGARARDGWRARRLGPIVNRSASTWWSSTRSTRTGLNVP